MKDKRYIFGMAAVAVAIVFMAFYLGLSFRAMAAEDVIETDGEVIEPYDNAWDEYYWYNEAILTKMDAMQATIEEMSSVITITGTINVFLIGGVLVCLYLRR